MSDRQHVPCNGCVRCCLGDAVRLMPNFGDDPTQYETEPHPVHGELMLAHKPDGSCVYLGPEGCTIHDRAPRQCRDMDCRNVAMAYTFTQARRLARQGAVPLAVWRRGKELLRCYGGAER